MERRHSLPRVLSRGRLGWMDPSAAKVLAHEQNEEASAKWAQGAPNMEGKSTKSLFGFFWSQHSSSLPSGAVGASPVVATPSSSVAPAAASPSVVSEVVEVPTTPASIRRLVAAVPAVVLPHIA